MNFGLISSRDAVIGRVKKVCTEFDYSLRHWQSLEEYYNDPEDCALILGSTVECAEPSAAAEYAQCISQLSPNSFIALVVEKTLREQDVVFVRKSGAGVVMPREEFEWTSKLEFVANQVIHARYIPIKAIDLVSETVLTFDVYHFLPQNEKFIAFLFSGNVLDAAKHERLRNVGEFYVRRDDATKFRQYVRETSKGATNQKIRECRSQFLMVISGFNDLVLNLTDRGGYASYEAGTKLLEDVSTLARELIECLRGVPNAWEVVDQMVLCASTSVERAPARAAYATLFGLAANFADLETVMVGSLLSDLGLLSFDPLLSEKIRNGNVETLAPDQASDYRVYPRKSLQVLLDRKLQITESMRVVICSKHERADGSGFPNRLKSERIPEECRFILLGDLFDIKTTLKLGQKRKPWDEAIQEILDDTNDIVKIFGPKFLPVVKTLKGTLRKPAP